MKKKISILLVMMMTLAMLTACGGNAGSNADADMDDAYLDLGPEYIGTENSQNSNVNGSGSNTSKAALEGVYWLHEDDVFRTGFYMDGNGKFIEMRNYDVVEGTYEMVSVYEVPEGIEYEIMRHLGGTVETIFYLISTDGKIEQEPFVYSVVDEKTFYAKEEETTTTETEEGCKAKTDPATFWLSFSSILLATVLIAAIVMLIIKNVLRKRKANASDAKSHYTVKSRVARTKKPVEEVVEETKTEINEQPEEVIEEVTEEQTEETSNEYIYGDVQDFGDEGKKE